MSTEERYSFDLPEWIAGVQAAVADAPTELTPEQEARLSALLQPVVTALGRRERGERRAAA